MKYCLSIIFSIFFLATTAQQLTISGFVKDKNSGEPLPFANIYFPTLKKGISANQYGYFSGKMNRGNIDIEASFVGYSTRKTTVGLRRDTTMVLFLNPPTIDEVTVSAKTTTINGSGLNRVALSIATIKEIPPFLGEYDLIKALALTPGVNNGTDGSSGLFVRGGSSDQNLILLDGATVYNNSHLFGFISIFNPEAISHAELFKGNFPARYGGRLSSVLNITMKEGNLQNNETSISISPISSQITNQGPLIKGKASYILSGRTTYSSLVTLPVYLFTKKDRFNYLMYDFNAKANYAFDSRNKLFVSLYTGNDLWNTISKMNSKQSAVGLNWGNTTASLRFTRTFKSGLFSLTQFTFNRFNFNYEISDKIPDGQSGYYTGSASTGSNVSDLTFKQGFEFATGIRNSFSMGCELSRQVFHPDYYRLINIDLGENIPDYRNPRYSFLSASVYLEDKFQLSEWINFQTGVRFSSQFLANKTYVAIEPRFETVVCPKKNISFNFSFSRMTQPVFQLTNTGQGLPIDVWAPITGDLKPSKSYQLALGSKFDLKELPVSFQAEVYYKKYSGLIDYDQGISFVTNVSKSWEEVIVKNGRGKSYGFEFMASKTTGKTKAWIAYTLSRNYRKFDQINQGQWYLARFDRTHDIEATLSHPLNKKWTFSATFVYTTGQPSTLANTVHEDIWGHKIPVFTSRNNLRMPDYHRMDVAFSKKFLTKKKNHPAVLSIGAYNVYSRINPFYVAHTQSVISDDARNKIGYKMNYTTGTLFGIIPYVNYSINF